MTEIILYPTETIYGLGVNALDINAINALFNLKKRPNEKAVSWIVRNVEDIKRYAILGEKEQKIAETFLPGPLTLVLPIRPEIIKQYNLEIETVAFRVSPDPVAQKLIAEYMEEHDAPLTCTSANLSNEPVMKTVPEILEQFGEDAEKITRVIDDGKRDGEPSTVISVIDGMVGGIREGAIPLSDIHAAIQ